MSNMHHLLLVTDQIRLRLYEETTGTNPSNQSSNTTGADEIASLPVASTSQDDGHPQKIRFRNR